MRSSHARLPGETPSLIGHNAGPPLDPGFGGRRHAWRRARAALAPHLPLEIVRRRVARARELGLSYPAYASILLGAGRDVIAFLFCDDALRLQAGRPPPADRVVRLAALTRADRLLLAAPEPAPQAVADQLAREHAIVFRAAAAATPGAGPQPGGAAVRAMLGPLKLPGDAVVMVGARADQRDWAEAARLAKFLAADAYFAP